MIEAADPVADALARLEGLTRSVARRHSPPEWFAAAEDAAGDALAEILSAIGRGEAEPTRTEVYTALAMRVRELSRRETRRRRYLLDSGTLRREGDPPPDPPAPGERFEAALALLAGRQAETVRLIYVDGLTMIETAAVQGVTRESVGITHRGALARLRRIYGSYETARAALIGPEETARP